MGRGVVVVVVMVVVVLEVVCLRGPALARVAPLLLVKVAQITGGAVVLRVLTCVHVVHIHPNDRDARIVCNIVSRHFMSLLLPFMIKRAIVMCTHTEYISSLMTWTQTIRLSEYSCWTIFNFVSPTLLHFKCARLGSTYPA